MAFLQKPLSMYKDIVLKACINPAQPTFISKVIAFTIPHLSAMIEAVAGKIISPVTVEQMMASISEGSVLVFSRSPFTARSAI